MPHQSKTVALSRQRGSGGSYVGRAVAERLGLRYIDREMLRHAAEYLRGQHGEERIETPATSWWSRLSGAFALGGPECGYVPPPSEVTYKGELFEIENRLLREIVEGHVAVIVGRGAAQMLHGRPGVVSVFLHAPVPWRVERVQQVYGLADRPAAQRMVHDSDRDRASFIQRLAGIDWRDVQGYDLALDTAAIGFDAAADLILRAVDARVEMAVARADRV